MTIERELAQAARDSRAALARRDLLIYRARVEGLTLRQIATLASLSVEGVRKVVSRLERVPG